MAQQVESVLWRMYLEVVWKVPGWCLGGCFGPPNIFVHKKCLNQKPFRTQVFYRTKIFNSKIILTKNLLAPNFFEPKYFMCPKIKGEPKKFHCSFRFISFATNMLEGWDIFYLKGGIQSSIWSRNTFLYVIRELRYKQNNIGYQISRIWNKDQSNIFRSDTTVIYA